MPGIEDEYLAAARGSILVSPMCICRHVFNPIKVIARIHEIVILVTRPSRFESVLDDTKVPHIDVYQRLRQLPNNLQVSLGLVSIFVSRLSRGLVKRVKRRRALATRTTRHQIVL
jgi:hypothetical protein